MKRDPIVTMPVEFSDSAETLFLGFSPPQLHIGAVLRGDAKGTLYVDSRPRPGAACLVAGDACYLAGTAPNDGFLDAVNALLPRDRYTALFSDVGVFPEALARAARGLDMLPARRRAAFLRRPPAGISVPDGVELLPIDRLLLGGDTPGTDAVREEVVDEWQTVDAFLDRGFGTVAMSEGCVVGHSIVDYIVRGACEIGIRVNSDYRRRGIGAAVAAATARTAFARGLETIIWHSWANNVGSIAISRRLGFGDEVFYTVLFNHWAAENISDMSQEEYRAFGEEYERLFAELPPAESGYPYVVAAKAWALGRDRARRSGTLLSRIEKELC